MDSVTEVPEEEYPFVGFGISWLTERALEYHKLHRLARPEIAFLDEKPTMAGAESDLIYWWHKRFIDFPELENRAWIRMIQRSQEGKKFNSERLRGYADLVGERLETKPRSAWIFRVSRIGVDMQSRQAIGHFYVDPANSYLNLGYTLVMGWDEADTIYLIKDYMTVGPGK